MKKRLLITSIVMMLVVAVALSTATYAWFTSNATVTANTVTMTATTNNAAALGISWTDGNYGTEITPTITLASADATFKFSPVTPASLATSGDSITDSDVAFTTALAHSAAGDFIFNSNGAAAPHGAYTWTNGAQTSFFVKNTSPSNALPGNLKLEATITGEGAALMRIGVFKYNGTSEKYELVAVLANQDANTYTVVEEDTVFADTPTVYYKKVLGKYVTATAGTATEVTAGVADYTVGAQAPAGKFYTATNTAVNARAVYGTITEGNSVNAMQTVECVTFVNLVNNLAANTAIELKIIAWMDGAALGDAEQNTAANMVLNFSVV